MAHLILMVPLLLMVSVLIVMAVVNLLLDYGLGYQPESLEEE